ncbi:uncharacterized protein BHQ10_006635 [Talaromyces amestolkiae]|uniref:Uncharacterized protein n=1 Tax=Talaromyces amestolkiae TaxID=1196081 RepID=A0A364L4B9_TALAM|nr:uncharacterized protein BHQ10_006635 [Talaromyces amestolkiae]RAO70623.1 hypothetical protein BHQ10_006635 [Talaromyces amestolkiae]
MSLQQSSQLLRPLCRSCARSPSFLLPSPTRSVTTISTNRSATRPYTISASRQGKYIQTSPAAEKKSSGYGKILGPQIPYEEWLKNYREVKAKLEMSYMQMCASAHVREMIDPSITPKIFLEIGRRLIDQAYHSKAIADSLKNIWKGHPCRIYEVAFAIRNSGPGLPYQHVLHWTMKATSDAGLVETLGVIVSAQIKKKGAMLPNSREIEMIKKIAYETDDPKALSVWADVARIWGQTEEALTIFQHLNKMVYPSERRPMFTDDISYGGLIKPPWSAMFDIYHKSERFDEANEMLKIGALHYRDPQALVSYAFIRKEKDDWEAYEQCLVAAAMSGHGDACFRLGNYYYLISKDEIPSRDQRLAERHRFRAWVAKIFGYAYKKEDWRRLASNWYEMASAHGISEGARNLAVLKREDGHPNAWELMEQLRSDPRLWKSKNVIKLRDQWDNPKFKPTLPKAWLEL